MSKRPETMSVEKSEKSDVIKRLYRGASDVVRRLDKIVKNASCVQDFYTSDIIALRIRLREICERLMFLDPVCQGKKAEDILWRKVHYETISAAKNFRKSTSWSKSDQYWISNHIRLGIGTYHHLLFRLQSEFQIQESGTDFLPLTDVKGSIKDKFSKRTSSKADLENDVLEWALQAYQRCLICMGDLTRYHQELCGTRKSKTASRYYHQALLVCTQSSMPHNQLGTLAGNKNYGCDAAYFYMRCIMSSNGFEGAKGNLFNVFEKNQHLLQACMAKVTESPNEVATRELLVKNFIIGFLKYCEECFKYPDVDLDLPVGHLCQIVIENFQKCLDMSQIIERHPVDNDEKKTLPGASNHILDLTTNVTSDEETPSYLSDRLIFKIFIMCMMCIKKLDKPSPYSSAATALTLAAFSHLLSYTLSRFKKLLFGCNAALFPSDDVLPSQDKLPSIPEEIGEQNSSQDQPCVASTGSSQPEKPVRPYKDKKYSLAKKNMRFRRKLNDTLSLEDSDLSEGEASSNNSESDETVSNPTDNEVSDDDGSSHCSEDEDDQPSFEVESVDKVSRSNNDVDGGQKKNSATECFADSNNKETDLGNQVVANSSDAPRSLQQSKDSRQKDAHKTDLNVDISRIQIDELESETVEKLLCDQALSVIKMCGDWLKSNPHIVTASAQGSHKLWSRYVDLLNLLSKIKRKLNTGDVNVDMQSKCETWATTDWQQTWPLPEDVILEGFPLLTNAYQTIDFGLRTAMWFNYKEEALLRLSCLQHLGFILSTYSELGLRYDKDTVTFSISSSYLSNGTENSGSSVVRKKKKNWTMQHVDMKTQDRKKHLMHNMAQLWLEAEVKELESSLESLGRPRFSPYLVPDSSVLIDSLHIVRQLMSSKIFIFILPIAVLQGLDRLKKESIKAREAIRWLEGEFRKRNRYFRAQKQHERMPLSLLKYPKRKEKQAWNNFAILECAHFFARQGSASNELSPNLVTVLTGLVNGSTKNDDTGGTGGEADKLITINNNNINNNSLFLSAASAGLKVENVEDLHGRWMASNKTASETK